MSAKLFTVNNKSDHAEILVTGPIGGSFWDESGTTEKAFRDALKDIPKNKPLVVGINSEGGSIQDGLGIFNAIANWEGPTTARIDGYAVSIASIIPLAADTVQSPKSSIWMIHEPWMAAQGNAEDMLQAAAALEKHSETLLGIYEDKTGIDGKEIRKMMKAETWFRGEEAIAMGFADEPSDINAAFASFDASKFNNIPSEILNTILGRADAPRKTSQAEQPASEPAPSLSVEDTEKQNKPAVTTAMKDQNMSEKVETPVAAATAPTIDINPLLEAINGLREDVKATKSAPGAEPLAPRIENLGNPSIEKFNSFLPNDHNARAAFVQSCHLELRNQLVKSKTGDYGVKASNTVDSLLVNTLVASDFITTMRTYMAPLAAFSRNVSLEKKTGRSVLEVNLLSTAGATQDNPTNFETGDTTSVAVPVTLAHINRSFHVNNAEQDLGLALAQKAPTNAKVMAEGIMAKVTALMTNANYGADVVIGAASDFAANDLPAILALGKNYANTTLIIDGGHLAYLLPTSRESFVYGEPGAYGFPGGIYKNNLWTSAATDIAGFVCGPDAVIWASAPCASGPSGGQLTTSSAVLEGVGITVDVNTWYALGSRAMWSSFDVCFGASFGDKTQAEVLTTA